MNPPPLPEAQTEKVRSGQKLFIYAILLNLFSFAIRIALPHEPIILIISGLTALVGIVLSILGILRLARGLGHHWALSVLFCFLMLIPIISLVVLVILSSQATSHLRAAGYTVGLLGADKKRR